jgi:DNA-binding Lrp family transcriptional regulator
VDRTDLTLCLLLLANSRTSYQELADRLGISVNAAHRRIKALVDTGVIRTFTARVGLRALGAITVWVFGRSDVTPLDDVHLKLKANDMVYWVAYSGGGFVYVGGYLPEVSRLDDFVSFVIDAARMKDATVGLQTGWGVAPKGEVQPLDYQIIRALHKDARKPVSEVAVEVKASARTVQRRLDRMLEKGLVELSLEWYPDASDDIVSLCHVRLAAGRDKVAIAERVAATLQPHVLFNVLMSNLPEQFISFIWTNSMRELNGIRESLLKEEGIEAVAANVLSIGYIFDTWRDRLLFGVP